MKYRTKLPLDIIILALLIILTAITLLLFDVSEMIYAFTRKHEDLELDELILTLAFTSFYMLLFIVRRFFTIKQLLKHANTDSLIGITNRRKGTEYILNEIEYIKSSTYNSSLIMYDLDHFKEINDTYGHDVGDSVLQEVTQLVIDDIRNKDSLIRWGGEEFILICPDCDLKDAANLAERFRAKIEKHMYINNIKLTASFGVSQLKYKENFKELLIRVDKNLYKSKESGRNKVTHLFAQSLF
ncbi:GGDEF domain-containing protein [Sulfurimonas sp.]|uniref:GGDEF domain-containing protein n=1 Tax=Sulfurimonas sp. TaxID=2022749 RepID=UPI002B4A51F7|nr:GGDEF domain-containing protein [Sulfurimonas sp.]